LQLQSEQRPLFLFLLLLLLRDGGALLAMLVHIAQILSALEQKQQGIQTQLKQQT
jgi:uncharacterized integral membrane protein